MTWIVNGVDAERLPRIAPEAVRLDTVEEARGKLAFGMLPPNLVLAADGGERLVEADGAEVEGRVDGIIQWLPRALWP